MRDSKERLTYLIGSLLNSAKNNMKRATEKYANEISKENLEHMKLMEGIYSGIVSVIVTLQANGLIEQFEIYTNEG